MRRSLPAALRSALNQTHKNYEILVLDDGSQDGTWEWLQRYEFKFRGRLRIFRNTQNKGLSWARNCLLQAAQGKYISILDADDRLIPQKLQRHAEILDHDSEVGVVWGKARVCYLDAHRPNQTLPLGLNRGWDLLTPYEVVHSSTTWRKSALIEAGGYDPTYVLVEGPDMFLKVGDKYLQKFDEKVACIKVINSNNMFRTQLKDENRKKFSQKLILDTLKRRHQLFLNEKPTWAV